MKKPKYKVGDTVRGIADLNGYKYEILEVAHYLSRNKSRFLYRVADEHGGIWWTHARDIKPINEPFDPNEGWRPKESLRRMAEWQHDILKNVYSTIPEAINNIYNDDGGWNEYVEAVRIFEEIIKEMDKQ